MTLVYNTEQLSQKIIQPHFINIESAICSYIQSADEIFICSAWLSSDAILEAASTRDAKLLMNCSGKMNSASYEYNPNFLKKVLKAIPDSYVYTSDRGILHHKFIVLRANQRPYAVITGSYNYTHQAQSNCENIVYIYDDKVAMAYQDEFNRLLNSSSTKRLRQ